VPSANTDECRKIVSNPIHPIYLWS